MKSIIEILPGAVARWLRGREGDRLICNRCPAPIAWDTARARPSGELGVFELVCASCTAGGPRAAEWFALRPARHEDGRERTHAGLTAAGWFWGAYLAALLVIASLALAAPAAAQDRRGPVAAGEGPSESNEEFLQRRFGDSPEDVARACHGVGARAFAITGDIDQAERAFIRCYAWKAKTRPAARGPRRLTIAMWGEFIDYLIAESDEETKR